MREPEVSSLLSREGLRSITGDVGHIPEYYDLLPLRRQAPDCPASVAFPVCTTFGGLGSFCASIHNTLDRWLGSDLPQHSQAFLTKTAVRQQFMLPFTVLLQAHLPGFESSLRAHNLIGAQTQRQNEGLDIAKMRQNSAVG